MRHMWYSLRKQSQIVTIFIKSTVESKRMEQLELCLRAQTAVSHTRRRGILTITTFHVTQPIAFTVLVELGIITRVDSMLLYKGREESDTRVRQEFNLANVSF